MKLLSPVECDQWRGRFVRRREWKRQITCQTPLDRLPWFANLLVECFGGFDRAMLHTTLIGWYPPKLEALRRAAGATGAQYDLPGFTFEKNQTDALSRVLALALSGTMDVRIFLSPADHALLADHDEYTTFLSKSSGKIGEVRNLLKAGRVKIVDYIADMP